MTVHSTARQVRDSVQWIYSEPMLIYYIQLFRDAYWPDGQLAAAAADPPTELQKLQMRRQAKSALLRNIPGLHCGNNFSLNCHIAERKFFTVSKLFIKLPLLARRSLSEQSAYVTEMSSTRLSVRTCVLWQNG